MFKPDYPNSIIGLMNSILASFDAETEYPSLELLPAAELRKSKNVILLVIDGLGYNFLKDEYENAVLREGLRGRISSVYPTTTASAITSFLTGVPPAMHGITGWNTYIDEIDDVLTILPFYKRNGGAISNPETLAAHVYQGKTVFEKIKSDSYYVIPKKLVNSRYTKHYSRNSHLVGVKSCGGLFSSLNNIVKKNNKKKYIYAYWHQYDHTAHTYGYNSKEAMEHMDQLAVQIRLLKNQLKGSNSTLIITADHGFMNTSKQRTIELSDFPVIQNCLRQPLCGESRNPFCYVKDGMHVEFLRHVKDQLSLYADIFDSMEIYKDGWFGPITKQNKIATRIGDYMLMMKDDYIIKDWLKNETPHYYDGRHGGSTENEMYVPLIVNNL